MSGSKEEYRVVYSSDYDSKKSEFKFIEVPSSILPEFAANRVVIKGGKDDEAVLCTSKETYLVRLVESTNSVLLLKGNNDPAQKTIECEATNHYELIPIQPKLHRLFTLLNESVYTGSASASSSSNNKLYSTDELKLLVQASELEIQEALKELNAFQIDGKWRMLEKSYKEEILSYIFSDLLSNGWNFTPIEEKTILTAIEQAEYEAFSAIQCLHTIGSVSTDAKGNRIWNLDPLKVCKHRGIELLSQPDKRHWLLEEFMEAWRDSLPDKANPDLSILQGEVLVLPNETAAKTTVSYFPRTALPVDPRARFRELFTARATWSLLDIEPFLRDIVPRGITAEQFLLRYARARQTPNGRVFQSKE